MAPAAKKIMFVCFYCVYLYLANNTFSENAKQEGGLSEADQWVNSALADAPGFNTSSLRNAVPKDESATISVEEILEEGRRLLDLLIPPSASRSNIPQVEGADGTVVSEEDKLVGVPPQLRECSGSKTIHCFFSPRPPVNQGNSTQAGDGRGKLSRRVIVN